MQIRCVVSCRGADGVPTFHQCTITCTQEQYDNGDHYDMAATEATVADYEDVGLVYDENDGPDFLFDAFSW